MRRIDNWRLVHEHLHQRVYGIRLLGPLRGVLAGGDELLELMQQHPGTGGAGARLAVLRLPGDQLTVLREEGRGGRRLRRCGCEGFGDLPPAHAHQVGETEAETRLALRPGREVDRRFDVLNPTVPGSPALAVAQPALQQLPVVGTHGHGRQALRQRKVGALAVAEKGLRQREHGDERDDPVRRTVARSLEAVAFPDQGDELGDETLLVEVLPGRLRRHRQIENRLIDVSDQPRLRQLRAQ